MMTVFSQSETQRSNAFFPADILSLSIVITSTNGAAASFAAADADALGEFHDKYLAVANRSGVRAAVDGSNGRFDKVFVNGDIEADFIDQTARFFGASIDFRDAFLPSLSHHVGDGHQVDVHGFQFSFDSLQLVRLYDGND
jgi:hypothetical protein